MRSYITFVFSILFVTACATPEEREIAALESELGLNPTPYFPKCLSEEVTPQAAVLSGDTFNAHTINNPTGDVPIDRCARWESEEPKGKPKEKAKPLVLTRSEDGDFLSDESSP